MSYLTNGSYPSNNWIPTKPEMGYPLPGNTQQINAYGYPPVDLGTIATFVNNATPQGEGEFIYLQGVANTVLGSLVTYDPATGLTSLTVAATNKNQGVPVAVAMSANLLTFYDWYQISGVAVIKKTAVKVSPNVPIYLSGTAGRIKSSAASGDQVLGARSENTATVTTTSSVVNVVIDRPHIQGQTI
jgi:hypothetical protein